jgi:small conductance mechanosensitive channel
MLNDVFAGFPGWTGPAVAVGLAVGMAWVVARLLTRALRVALHRVVGDRVEGEVGEVLRVPLRVAFLVAFLLLAAVLTFPALEVAGLPTNVGFDRQALMAWAFGSGLRIVLILVLSWLLVRIIGSVVTRLERDIGRSTSPDALERARRVRTLGTLIYNTVGILVGGAALLMVLRELRVDIVPLLTGAGILGLAVGFGAQSLVKDVISGFFLILENQVRVGDVANINGTGGAVEGITLRTITLRDLNGTVHVFPNGSINTLANLSKDFSYAVLDVGVAYTEDVDRVFEVMTGVGETLRADATLRASILEPLEILGVEAFADSAVMIRARIKTLPLKQWAVAREYRRRLKRAFDEAGIVIPFPQMALHVSEPLARAVATPGGGRPAAPADPDGSVEPAPGRPALSGRGQES